LTLGMMPLRFILSHERMRHCLLFDEGENFRSIRNRPISATILGYVINFNRQPILLTWLRSFGFDLREPQ
jgi:hypothetical protein